MIIQGYHEVNGPIDLTADKYGKNLIVQPPEHYMTHEGKHFLLNRYFSSVDNGSTAELLFTTGEMFVHAIFFVTATSGVVFAVYENSTKAYVYDNRIQPISRNRPDEQPHYLTNACHTPSGSGNGVAIFPSFPVGTGVSAASSAPASGRDVNEYLLKQNTKYLLVATSLLNANKINIGTDFYWREE